MATLLIIEDSAAHRAQIARAIGDARVFDELIEAEDGAHGLKVLLDRPVDVVLCDLEMPGIDGEKVLRVKEATPATRDAAFVFLTGSQDVARRVRLLEEGAADLILKPFHPGELVARLRLHLQVKRLQDELRVKNETVARLSTTDALTGLRTRRYSDEVLAIEFLRARRYGSPLSVMKLDIDRLKRIDDDWGYPAGDAVLHGVASRVLAQLRATDLAGRYGGDEFIVILSQSDAHGARILAERWREAIGASEIDAGVDAPLRARVSIGVAEYDPAMKSPEDLVAVADAALLRAKEKGGDRVEG